MLEKIFGNYTPSKVYTFDELLEKLKYSVENDSTYEMDELEKSRYEYKVMNLQRMNRILKTYKPSDEILSSLKNITDKQHWVIITENWCGDSAQNLPYIYKFVEQNDNINLHFVLRDENVEFAEYAVTEGNPMSIPRILAYNENGDLLFMWGARPKEAQDIVTNAKAEGKSKEEFNKELHLFYGRNRGKAVENEFVELFDKFADA